MNLQSPPTLPPQYTVDLNLSTVLAEERMALSKRLIGTLFCYILSIGAFICGLFVVIGGSNKSSNFLDSIYFLQIDLRRFLSVPPTLATPGVTHDNQLLLEALRRARQHEDLDDYYSVYMWNYCSGGTPVTNVWSQCSQTAVGFWSNLVQAWNLTQPDGKSEVVLSNTVENMLAHFKAGSQWVTVAYILSLIAKVMELVLGVSALLSRWGILVTTFASIVS